MDYIFISYSSVNEIYADTMRKILLKRGYPVWMALYDIPPGEEYGAVLNKAIEGCACLMLLLSHDSQESEFVNKEIETAVANHKPIIPVGIEKVVLKNALRFFIGNRHIAYLPEPNEELREFRRIFASLNRYVTPKVNGGDVEEGKSGSSGGDNGGGNFIDQEDIPVTYGDLVEEFINNIQRPFIKNDVKRLSQLCARQARECFGIPETDKLIYTYRHGLTSAAASRNPQKRFLFTTNYLAAPKRERGCLSNSVKPARISWQNFVNARIEDGRGNWLKVNGEFLLLRHTKNKSQNSRDKWRYYYLDLQKYLKNNQHRVNKY